MPGGPWTLHQLRHSALTHAAEDGANTATLLAYSGHTSVTSLARYTRLSPEALARWQHNRDAAEPRRKPLTATGRSNVPHGPKLRLPRFWSVSTPDSTCSPAADSTPATTVETR